MNITRHTKLVTIPVEVEVDWDEDDNGTKQFVSAQCQSLAPVTVQAWAESRAWRDICGVW
jgi:hypothetical protein